MIEMTQESISRKLKKFKKLLKKESKLCENRAQEGILIFAKQSLQNLLDNLFQIVGIPKIR